MESYFRMPELTRVVTYKKIHVSSSAFGQNDFIPPQYTCDGKNINPPLNMEHIPEGTKSLAVIVDDPDAPIGTWVHWVMWNIPVMHHFKENFAPGTEGINDFSKHAYSGPCPPKGTHRYYFKVYALDSKLHLPANTNKRQLEKVMAEHITGYGELVGLYKRDIIP